jgi:hypothetical protein
MNKSVYLSGSIEYSKDPSSWRNKMEKELYGICKVINPSTQFCPLEKEDTITYKEWIYNNFIIPDIQDVMRCSHFFIKIDKATGRGSGTWGELTVAAYLNKRTIYMIDGIDIPNIPGWSLGCLAYAHKVDNIDEAIDFIKKDVI